MFTKHVRTAADLARFKCGLKIECGGCGNSRTLDGIEVAKTYGIKSRGDPAAHELFTRRGEGGPADGAVAAGAEVMTALSV